MRSVNQPRRSFLATLGGLGIGTLLPRTLTARQTGAQKGYVLGPTEGEHLVHFRDGGDVTITVGNATGSARLAVGMQQVKRGTGIPIHRHLQAEESFYVLEGSGVAVLGDVRHPLEKGSTIFIPMNTWHGFENPDRELRLLWIVSPPGLDGFFRETCTPRGAARKSLTREQIREIARKYGTEYR